MCVEFLMKNKSDYMVKKKIQKHFMNNSILFRKYYINILFR